MGFLNAFGKLILGVYLFGVVCGILLKVYLGG